MVKAYIGLGSNLGERYRNIEKAITFLERTPGIKVNRYSSFCETEPVGYKDQPWFINCVLEIETKLPAQGLLKNLLEIEKKLGRKRRIKWSPRIIDLDILFYGEKIIKEKDLTIPHPRLEERKFVLVPLNEINPQIYHPQLKKTVHQLLKNLKEDKAQVKKLPSLIPSGSARSPSRGRSWLVPTYSSGHSPSPLRGRGVAERRKGAHVLRRAKPGKR